MIVDASAALARIEQVRSRLRVPWWSLLYDAATRPAFVVTCRSVAEHLLAAPFDQSEGELRWNTFGDAALADVFVLADDTTIGFSVDGVVAELYVRTQHETIGAVVGRFRGALGGTPWEHQYPEGLVPAPPQFEALSLVAGDTNVRLALVELHQAIARIDFTHHGARQATVRDRESIAAAIRDILAWQPALQDLFGDDPIPDTFRHHAAIRAAIRAALRSTRPAVGVQPLALLERGISRIDDSFAALDRGTDADEMFARGRRLIAQAFASTDPDALAVLRVISRSDTAEGLQDHDRADALRRARLFLGS